MRNMIRIATIDTGLTGKGMMLTCPEGRLEAIRQDPHGVVLLIDGGKASIKAHNLADIGRFFLAAAVALGQDIEDGPKP